MVKERHINAYVSYLVDGINNYKFPQYVPVCCNTSKWYKWNTSVSEQIAASNFRIKM
jgi:hypothetical protein